MQIEIRYPASSGQIAKFYGVPQWQITYAVKTRKIAAEGKIGPLNAYGRRAIKEIGEALEAIHARRQGANHAG